MCEAQLRRPTDRADAARRESSHVALPVLSEGLIGLLRTFGVADVALSLHRATLQPVHRGSLAGPFAKLQEEIVRPVRELRSAIEECVERSLANEASLEDLVSGMLYGRRATDEDAAWPIEHRLVWALAVIRFREASNERMEVRSFPHPRNPDRTITRRLPKRASVAEVWTALTQLAERYNEPWNYGSHLQWRVLAEALGMPTRAAIRLLVAIQGWRFESQKTRRRCTRAVCVECGTVVEPSEIRAFHCTTCRQLGSLDPSKRTRLPCGVRSTSKPDGR